jgi:type I restriction enzyme S subunit
MMKAAQLRQAILQAAVQGKLVPQNPHDEPASALLERIHAEKAKLIKVGKLKKEKPLPPIVEDEKPYQLPKGWVWAKLGNITQKVHYGYTASAGSKGNTKLLRITDIQNNTVNWGSVPYCMIENSRLSDYQLNNNDILVARTGGTIGKTYLVANISDTAVFASYLIRVVPFSFYDIEYLKYFFESPLYWAQLRDKSMGTGQPNVNGVSLSNLIMPLPSLTEQQRIVAKANKLMAMCDELEAAEKASDALDEHFAEYLPKSILQTAVQGKLVPQNPRDEPASALLERIRAEKAKLIKAGKLKKDKPLPPITEDEIPHDLPDGWGWCRLGEIADLKIGKTPARAESVYWSDGIYPWVSIADMITGHHISSTKEKISQLAYDLVFKKAIVPKGSLLFSFKLSIGKVSILDIDAFTNEAICSITPYRHSELIDYLFRVIPVLDLLSGAKDAIKGKTLNSKSLADVLIPLPPLAEQQRIVAKVDELMALCAKLKTVAENVEMSETKQATIIPLGRPQENEPLRMAARGKVNKEVSEAHRKAREDMFNDD